MKIRENLEASKFRWVTILADNNDSSSAPTPQELVGWHESFPAPDVIVMGDDNRRMAYGVVPWGFKKHLIDDQFRWKTISYDDGT